LSTKEAEDGTSWIATSSNEDELEYEGGE